MVKVTGTEVHALQRAFLIDWYFVDRTLINDRKYYPSTLTASSSSLSSMQMVTSGPDSPQPEIMQDYVRTIIGAKQYVYIETPYFLPTESVLFALKTAASAGVDVRILVPKENDSWFVEWAGRSYLREVQKTGIRVKFYTAGFLHSKLMVCDDTISTCGSTNVDFRSFENNFEANVFFYGHETAMAIKQLFIADEEQSVPMKELRRYSRPTFIARLTESLLRLLAPLM
jgi:cardiolipin synthase